MIRFLKKLLFKIKLKRKYHLDDDEIKFLFSVLKLLNITDNYEMFLEREYFVELLHKLYSYEKFPDDFPSFRLIDEFITSIDRKIFAFYNKIVNIKSTKDLRININCFVLVFDLELTLSGVIFDIDKKTFDIRILSYDKVEALKKITPQMEVLFRISDNNIGIYECLTNVTKIQLKPFALITLEHNELIHQEKRRFIRYTINHKLPLIITRDNPPQTIRINVNVIDISLGGLSFSSNLLFNEKDIHLIEIDIGNESTSLPIKIIKRRFNIEEKLYYYHCAFQGISFEEKMKLEYFIRRNIK